MVHVHVNVHVHAISMSMSMLMYMFMFMLISMSMSMPMFCPFPCSHGSQVVLAQFSVKERNRNRFSVSCLRISKTLLKLKGKVNIKFKTFHVQTETCLMPLLLKTNLNSWDSPFKQLYNIRMWGDHRKKGTCRINPFRSIFYFYDTELC